jgi:soluble lytic murein transglycosylase-like protein
MLAVLAIESGGQPNAESHAGAKGLYQLTSVGEKEVCIQFGCEPGYDIWNEQTNMRMGWQLLSYYLTEANGDYIGMIVLYNSGYVGYRKYLAGEPLAAETEAYIIKFKHLRRYYATLFSRMPEDVPMHYDLISSVVADNVFDVDLLGRTPGY